MRGDERSLGTVREFDTEMITRIGNCFPLSRLASTALGETRLAVRAAPNVVRYLAPIVAWAVASIALGFVLGISAVILPPMGAFAIVAAAGLVLLWVMPDLPLVSPRLIRMDVLRHDCHRSHRSLLLRSSVFRSALDFSPAPRDILRSSCRSLSRLQRRLTCDDKLWNVFAPRC